MAEVIGGMAGALQGTVGGVLNKGQSFLDRFFPPEKRNELWAKLSKFATEKPMLASFIFSQIALTGFPLGLFIIMTITVVVFSLLGALLLGLLGALVFIVIVVGFALLILLPVLFITTFAAAFIWLWGVGAYFILKWFNKKEIPGIHTALPSGMSLEDLASKGGDDTAASEKADSYTNGYPSSPPINEANKHPSHEKHPNGTPKQSSGEKDKKKNIVSGAVSKVPAGNKVNDTTKGLGVDVNGDPTKAVDVGQVAGKTGDVGKVAGKTGDVGKLAGKAGDVGKVKDLAGGVLG